MGEVVLNRHSMSTVLKFVILSAIGIFAFFVNFPIEEHTLSLAGYSFTVSASKTFLVNHITSYAKAVLMPIMPYVVLAFAIWGVADLYIRREKHFNTPVQTTFSIFKIIGVVFLSFVIFDYGPEAIRQASVGPFLLNKILISITISIPMAALFLPFLLDYGLVDFVGILMRPIMRPVFNLPGRAAVITVSAFLGNFSIGHIAINDQYKEGKMNLKESAIIATSLSTVSIAFLIVLANATGVIAYWNIYFWTTFLITLLVTFIGIRLYPLRSLPEDYYPGALPSPEPVFKKDLVKNAVSVALDVAERSEPVHKRIAYLMKETSIIMGTVASGTAFFGTVGILVNMYTPFFQWVGYIFYPFLWLVQIPSSEIAVAAKGTAVCFLEVTLPALLVTGPEYSMRLKYLLAVLPVSAIIFLASFIPCLMATEVPIKFSHMVIIWFERAILTILIAGLFAWFLFPV